MQISGLLGSDSLHVASRSKMHPSPYSGPSESEKKCSVREKLIILNLFHFKLKKYQPATYFIACDSVLSGLHDRIKRSFLNTSKLL